MGFLEMVGRFLVFELGLQGAEKIYIYYRSVTAAEEELQGAEKICIYYRSVTAADEGGGELQQTPC